MSTTLITMIDVYLPVGKKNIHFLSIPLHEIRNLSTRPFNWLRFVVFAICGARGELYAIPDDPESGLVLVNYDTLVTELVDGGSYVYESPEDYIFVDQHGLSDRITSTVRTERSRDFRDGIIRRDESCVVTQRIAEICDAAHLIPRSKSDEYIKMVVQARSARYDPTELEPIFDINAIQNGVLLNKDLHASFGSGGVAFLQTPNFAMVPDDIPRSEPGPIPDRRITLQRFAKPDGFNIHQCIDGYRSDFDLIRRWPNVEGRLHDGCDVDAHIGQESRPPAVILDFVYGVAAYRRWMTRSESADTVMNDYYTEHYEAALNLPPRDSPGKEQDDPRDPDYVPEAQGKQGRTLGKKLTMADAMDEMNRFIMSLCGTTPEEVAAKREKEMEEEERIRQEESRSKVQEWIQGTHIIL